MVEHLIEAQGVGSSNLSCSTNPSLKNPICYITGERIDLSNPNSYSLDHINPYHLSQDNSVENLGLTTKDANQSKCHLTLQQYIELCRKVVEYNRVMD